MRTRMKTPFGGVDAGCPLLAQSAGAIKPMRPRFRRGRNILALVELRRDNPEELIR